KCGQYSSIIHKWLQEIYCAIKLGSTHASMKAFMFDKFLAINTSETYEK
ncbi:6973_t:CDS:1, partial [Funneliformis geosporum]